MKSPKKPITFRLSETTLRELTDIAKRQGVSQADVITVLVHLFSIGGDTDDAEEWFNIARMS
jgi:hypothetical protein